MEGEEEEEEEVTEDGMVVLVTVEAVELDMARTDTEAEALHTEPVAPADTALHLPTARHRRQHTVLRRHTVLHRHTAPLHRPRTERLLTAPPLLLTRLQHSRQVLTAPVLRRAAGEDYSKQGR